MAVRKVGIVFRERTINWLRNGKQIIVLLFLCVLANYTISPILKLSRMTEQPVQMWEPFLAAANSKYIFSGLLLGFLVLCSDYHSMDGIKNYLISRTGKKCWYVGNILFAFASVLIYLTEILVIFSIWGSRCSYVENGWSLLTRYYNDQYSELGRQVGIICMVSDRIFHHFTPMKAVLMNLFCIGGVLLLLHCLIILTGMFGSMQRGMIADGILILTGLVLIWVNHPLQRFHPLGNALLYTMNDEVLKSRNLSFVYCYHIVINLLLILLGAVKISFWKGTEKA
ncbi:MAG: hypothetical protein ACI4SE_10020 [Lachnospiraceae bacterium]